MKRVCTWIVFSMLVGEASAGIHLDRDRGWMRISDPLIMSSTFNRQFASLPLKGKTLDPQKNWSSDYWARKKGGINFRWFSATPIGFNLNSPTREEVSTMSQDELEQLAPSEKWDIANGRYDYPLRNEIARYASPDRPLWEGICDGWAGAAMNHDEPVPQRLTNPDGVSIPFGSSDIKGLLSWYYAKKHSGGYGQMGRRCYGENTNGEDRCLHDMNAGAFHIVLTNRLGIQGLSFVADIDRNREVWNHLTWKFVSRVRYRNLRPRATSAPGTARVVRVRTVVDYVFIAENSWLPVLGTSRHETSPRTYEYYLDLNEDGRIIGGDWITSHRPDFLWLERKVTQFKGLFTRLPEVLTERPVERIGENVEENSSDRR